MPTKDHTLRTGPEDRRSCIIAAPPEAGIRGVSGKLMDDHCSWALYMYHDSRVRGTMERGVADIVHAWALARPGGYHAMLRLAAIDVRAREQNLGTERPAGQGESAMPHPLT